MAKLKYDVSDTTLLVISHFYLSWPIISDILPTFAPDIIF